MLCVIKIVVSLHRSKQSWCRSSVWLECLPVTQEVDGSSPFGTAKRDIEDDASFFCLKTIQKSVLRIFEKKLRPDFSYGLKVSGNIKTGRN